MIALDRHGPAVAAALGGTIAGYSIRESLGYGALTAESERLWYAAFVSPQWAGTIAVITAVTTAAVVHSRRSSALAAACAVVGCLVVALPSLVPIAANQALTTNAIGAGIIVGVCGHVAAGRPGPSAALGAGLLGSMLFYAGIDVLLPSDGGRWLVVIGGPELVGSTVPLVLLLVTAGVLGTVAVRTASGIGGFESGHAVVAVVLAFVFLLVYVYLGNTISTVGMCCAAVVVVGVLTYAASLNLDGPGVVVGLAVAASMVNSLGWSDRSWWVLLIGVALFVGAVVVGLRRSWLQVGLLLLAVVTVTGLIPVNGVGTVAYSVFYPVAVGLVIGAAQPMRAAESTVVPLVVPMVPFAMTLFWISAPVGPREFYWSDGSEDEVVPPIVVLYSPLAVGVIAAVLVVVGSVAVVRRSDAERLQ